MNNTILERGNASIVGLNTDPSIDITNATGRKAAKMQSYATLLANARQLSVTIEESAAVEETPFEAEVTLPVVEPTNEEPSTVPLVEVSGENVTVSNEDRGKAFEAVLIAKDITLLVIPGNTEHTNEAGKKLRVASLVTENLRGARDAIPGVAIEIAPKEDELVPTEMEAHIEENAPEEAIVPEEEITKPDDVKIATNRIEDYWKRADEPVTNVNVDIKDLDYVIEGLDRMERANQERLRAIEEQRNINNSLQSELLGLIEANKQKLEAQTEAYDQNTAVYDNLVNETRELEARLAKLRSLNNGDSNYSSPEIEEKGYGRAA